MKQKLQVMSVKEIFQAIEKERVNPNNLNDKTNKAKTFRKLDFLENYLGSVPQNVEFVVDGTWGNGRKRDYFMPNAGTVVECVIHYFIMQHCNHIKHNSVAKSARAEDVNIGPHPYEIKASLECNAKCTPVTGEFDIILCNQDGISIILKEELPQYLDKNRKLPHKGRGHDAWAWLVEDVGLEL